MAEYKGIHGTKVQDYTTDPANPIKGQVWYNETANTIRVEAVTTVGSWATGGNLNTARYYSAGAAGDNTAALVSGGVTNLAITELYNGSAWTEVNDLNTGRDIITGSGTSTSALDWGGEPPVAITESWNGTSWSEVADLNTARYGSGGAGVSNTSALAFGGNPISGLTELWGGSSWTEVADLNTARDFLGGSGTATSALAFGGEATPGFARTQTESWNGSSWTAVSALNTGRAGLFGAGEDNTAALAFGGASVPGVVANTESWNGSAWTEVADLSTVRYIGSVSNTGTASSAIAAGGLVPPGSGTTATEEWTGAGSPQVRTITTD